jgi:hypothetical protein
MRTIVLPAWTVPTPGTVVADKYVVETEYGRDGLAAMFLGTQIDLERRVVIRVLLPQWADDPRAIAQFRREGRGAWKARGPRPAILAGGTLRNGAPFAVLEALPADGRRPELDAWPLDARTSGSWRGGSDRVAAGGVFMLGALGTAAFMWLHTTVHANDPHDLGATAPQPSVNLLDGGDDDSAAAEAGGLAVTIAKSASRPAATAPASAGLDAGNSAARAPSGDWLGPMHADAGPTVRELRRHLSRVQRVHTEAFDSPETRPVPAPLGESPAADSGVRDPSLATIADEPTTAPERAGAPAIDPDLLDRRQ